MFGLIKKKEFEIAMISLLIFINQEMIEWFHQKKKKKEMIEWSYQSAGE